MKISKDSLKVLRSDINEALADVAKRHGLTIRAGNATFDGEGAWATFKLDVTPPGITKAESQFAANFGLYKGLMTDEQKGWLGRSLSHIGKQWKVIGYNPKRTQTPFVIKSTEGVTLFASSVWLASRIEA